MKHIRIFTHIFSPSDDVFGLCCIENLFFLETLVGQDLYFFFGGILKIYIQLRVRYRFGGSEICCHISSYIRTFPEYFPAYLVRLFSCAVIREHHDGIST